MVFFGTNSATVRFPIVDREVERGRQRAEQHDVGGALVAEFFGHVGGVDRIAFGDMRRDFVRRSRANSASARPGLRLRQANGGTIRLVSQMKMPVPGFRNGSQRRPSAHSSATRMSASPFGMVGDHTRWPKRTWLNTRAAALGHAVHFALLDLEAARLRQQRQHLGHHDDALAADADDQHVERLARGRSRPAPWSSAPAVAHV